MDDDEARDRLLSAAEDLYYRKGFAAVGMDELRGAAEISMRRLYQVFPSKDEIVLAFLQRKREQWRAGVEARVAAAGSDHVDRILAVFGFLEDWFTSDSFRGCAFINAFGELGGTHPEVVELVRQQKLAARQALAQLVREAGGDEALAAQLSLLSEGAQTAAATGQDPAAARHARDAARALLTTLPASR